MSQDLSASFLRLVQIMDELREQCPWDKKQTLQTLRLLTIEEMYELADAILSEDANGVKEELGDLMLHLVFYARIAKEKQWFSLTEVLDAICEKLIRRHPHIYGDVKAENEEQVKQNWELIKKQEKKGGLLNGVPAGLPAMVKAFRLQEKTGQVGFEWEHTDQVWVKVMEEMEELKEAIDSGKSEKINEEFGDLLFAMVNYARFLKVDPEAALEQCNRKFKSRFEYIEKNSPRPLTEMNLEEMDRLWNEAKSKLSTIKID